MDRDLKKAADNIRRTSEEILFLLGLTRDAITEEERCMDLTNAADILELNVKEFKKLLI